MILQIDPRFTDENIKKYGCYYMCILFLCNKLGNIELDPESIERAKHDLVLKHVMGTDCYIKDPRGVLDYFGLSNIIYMGHAKKDYKEKKNEYSVLCYKRQLSNSSYKHFVCGEYDPMGVSNAVRFGKLESKRIYFRGE